MSWAHRFRLRQQVKGSLWLVPMLCAVVGPLLAEATTALDRNVELPAAWNYTASTATTVLSAIVGATVGLTGFVVAFGVLIVQMATQTLSPRYMRLWYRDVLQKAVLGTFLGTITFSYSLLRRVEPDSVPDIGVTLAGLAVTASLILFLLYLNHFIHRLRPVAVAAGVAEAGARVFSERPRAVAEPPERLEPARDPLLCVTATTAGALQAIDQRGLVAAAVAHDCVLALPRAVGDFVTLGTELVDVYGDAPGPSADRIRGMIAIGDERTIEQDPGFALRVLVDIAIRALSPAVNDPTTAVQLLDRVEQLLQLIGTSDLGGRGELRDDSGRVRVVIATPAWEDFLALGVREIRHYGATSAQVTRRLRAVLESLHERVRPEHRPAVAREIQALDAAVEALVPDEAARRFAGRPDRQGIGGTGSARAGFTPTHPLDL
jgi:uncharacterized membrane protein